MPAPENAYSLHITHHAAINALLSLLLPRWGVSAPIVRNPGCRIATLACPGLGARYPFGVPVERMVSANPYRSSPLHAWPAPCHSLEMRMKRVLRVRLLYVR